ncbi:MAG: histidine kinase dimerization/phospho-acceptor domain-containing protein, partial [Planctomycetota bacterium]
MPNERGRSLTKQLLGAFALFGLALLVTYALVVPRLVLSTEDRIFARQLEEHVQLARAAIEEGRDFDARPAPGVRVAQDGAGFEPAIAAWISALEPGRHEFNDEAREGTDEREFFVAVEELAGGERLQVVYEVGAYEGMEGVWDRDYLTTIGVGVFVALAASLLGLFLVTRLSRSLRELERLGAASPLDADAGLDASRRSDEVGRIARSWRAASERSREALEREQRFTRDASHELRTPITAALGALENLDFEKSATPERRGQLI